MTRAAGHRRSTIIDQRSSITTYWERTHWPLQSLYFLLPLIVLYEVGIAIYAADLDISARTLLRVTFSYFGVTGYFLPGLMALAYLLAAHLIRRDPWQPEPKLWAGMWGESLVLVVPLLVMAMMLSREAAQLGAVVPLAGTAGSAADGIPSWQAGVVLSVGAGIYEELLFRVIIIAAVHLLLVDVLHVPGPWGAAAAVTVSAVAFSLYHFVDLGAPTWAALWQGFRQSFSVGLFAFYGLAGVYLALVYLLRGFGIVAATHALYNVLVVTAGFVESNG